MAVHRGALAVAKLKRQGIQARGLFKVSLFRLLESSRPRLAAPDCLNTITPAPRVAQTIWGLQTAALVPPHLGRRSLKGPDFYLRWLSSEARPFSVKTIRTTRV